jgi:hypothetical protein
MSRRKKRARVINKTYKIREQNYFVFSDYDLPKGFISKSQRKERSDVLFRLGFSDYKSYLKSDLWKDVRKKVMERDQYRCKFCNKKATHVHHEHYNLDTMSGKNLRHLHSVCKDCHENGHNPWDGAVKPRKKDFYQF